jgi:hypothetical protein
MAALSPVVLPDELPRLPDTYANQCPSSLQQGIKKALTLIYPDHSITSHGILVVARILNQFSHALLLSIEMNGDTCDPSRAFLFPSCAGMGELYAYGIKEVANGQPVEQNACMKHSDVLRWIEEFRELHSNSFLTKQQQQQQQQQHATLITVTAWVDYMAFEILEVAGRYSSSRSLYVIDGMDVIRSISFDDELKPFTKYLGDSHSYVDIMSMQFESNRDAWREFDQGYSWFHNAAKVDLYAQQYARGELLLGDDYFFRQHGIRPLQFFGNHLSHYLKLSKNDTNPNERGCVVFSFEVRDAHGAWLPLVCELRASHSLAQFRTADNGQLVASIQSQHNLSPCCVVALTDKELARFMSNPSTHKRQRLEDEHIHSVFSSTTLPAPIIIAQSKPLDNPFRHQIMSESENILTRKRKQYETALETLANKLKPQAFLEDKLIIATQLSRLDRFGPSLFTSNHPLKVRARFTAALIDHVSTQNGLPMLPTVLLQLIGEYDPVTDLPYIQGSSDSLHRQEDAAKRFTHTFI